MGSFSEQDSIDPDDPELDYSPLRLSERAAKLGPSVSQAARSEPIRSSLKSRPAPSARKTVNEPVKRKTDPEQRAALFGVAARIAAVAGIVAAVALLVVIIKPASHQSVASSNSSEITGSTAQPNQEDVESQPALAELKAPAAPAPDHVAAQDHELLQRFLQWREKADTSEASR
jgi:hypothetical protein